MPTRLLVAAVCLLVAGSASAQETPIVAQIPKATKPIAMDGSLSGWDGAFVTTFHVGHPNFANRGGQFLLLWDEKNLYVGLRCLDKKTAHVGPDGALWNGDAVEFYLDTRRGDKLGAKEWGPGTLHMFWTPFTKFDVKPRWALRDMPAMKGVKLQGVELAAIKTPTGYTAEFKLPWANFPDFSAKVAEIIGMECELCSSDGGPRVDRTFVFASPKAVDTPSAFGRVQLVESLDLKSVKAQSRALMPLTLTQSTNYAWLYGAVGISPTIEAATAKIEGKLLDSAGKVRKASSGSKASHEGIVIWTGSWELYDLPAGIYTLEIAAFDKSGAPIASRSEKVVHGNPPAGK